MDLNLIERGIASLAPRWGAKRIASKVALAQLRSAVRDIDVRGYDAARRGRRTDGWHATGGSANAELSGALGLVRRRSRDLCRNNEWAKNAKRKWVAHLVGTGIQPRPADGKEQAKKTAREAWNAFADNCDPEGLTDIYGLQARVVGEVFEGGAAFVRWYLRPPSFGLKVPLQCEVLEHDFLDTDRTEVRGDNIVIHGVEFDPWGRRVAYWLFPQHPGDVALVRRGGFVSQRVPAADVDHVFDVERAGQVTGVPWLAGTMLRLRDLGDYEEAELVRKKIEACFAVFVRREGSTPAGLAQSADRTTDSSSRKIETLRPGMIAYVEGQGDITTAQPSAAGDTGYVDRQLGGFAAGIGLTRAQASGDLSDVNFTSLREGKLDFWPVLDQKQWHMLAPQLVRPSWRRCMAAAAGRGLQVSPDQAAKIAMPKRPWVNPADDMKAEAGELALALESWADKVTARGYDPDELILEIESWNKKLQAAGISITTPAGIAGDRLQQQDVVGKATPKAPVTKEKQ